jgi:NAD(P)-dependent dehydrogenase (short-subunit alcohol dehydrogenase family)
MSDNSTPQFVVNVTSSVIHMTSHPQVAERPAYILSKMTGTLLFQLIALSTSPKKVQIVTYNPGLVYGDGWKAMGFRPESFDSGKILLSAPPEFRIYDLC